MIRKGSPLTENYLQMTLPKSYPMLTADIGRYTYTTSTTT
jgi:hypothetical protein